MNLHATAENFNELHKEIPTKTGNIAGNSNLKWTYTGRRKRDSGAFSNAGQYGDYWSSTPHSGNLSFMIYFALNDLDGNSYTYRANGQAVRCIKDDPKYTSDLILARIGKKDPTVTADELNKIIGVTGVDPNKESAYQDVIKENTNNLFSNPVTVDQVQKMIDTIDIIMTSKSFSDANITDSNTSSYIVNYYDNNTSTDINITITPNATHPNELEKLLVKIPYSVSAGSTGSASPTIPAYKSTPVPIAKNTESNDAKATLEWAEQTNLNTSVGTFDANITVDEIYTPTQENKTSDVHGTVVAKFLYPTGNGKIGTLTLKLIPGIPDRSFYTETNGKLEHRFVYFPTKSNVTGKIWLNNNLGAEYSNVDSTNFNPKQQATKSYDHLAYGSLFQWGRKADGHELIDWKFDKDTDVEKAGTPKYSTITSIRSDEPDNPNFITNNSDWRSALNNNLWAKESSVNNVCPKGYRLPLNSNGKKEFYAEANAWSSQNGDGALSSTLALSIPGNRRSDNGVVTNERGYAYYWAGSVNGEKAHNVSFYSGTVYPNDSDTRANGFSVRCLKN